MTSSSIYCENTSRVTTPPTNFTLNLRKELLQNRDQHLIADLGSKNYGSCGILARSCSGVDDF